MRSDQVKAGLERAAHRSLLHALGLSRQEIERPWIGVANSWNEMVPGHKWLRQLGDRVKEGIISSGGLPFEFDCIGICDGLCQGHEGMKFVLPSRELVCDSIEAMTESNRLDGLVLISSCDKIIPGQVMAAARLNLPSVVVTGGPMMPGKWREQDLTLVDMREFIGRVQSGEMTPEELAEIEQLACPGFGSCAMMGTANTMSVATEALGMSLPGTASSHAGSEEKLETGFLAGERVMKLVDLDVRTASIMTERAFENSIRVIASVGGSLNSVLHMVAIAGEAGVDISLEDFDRLSRTTPQLCKIKPSGKQTMWDFYQAGGVPAVFNRLEGLLNLEAMTVCGETVGQIARRSKVSRTDVVRSVETPYSPEGGIRILRGPLAPGGAVVKISALTQKMMSGRAPARVFDDLESAIDWIRKEDIQDPVCIVIRYEGPKGGPGMREMHMITSLIVGRGLADRVFLATDGRFSGSTRGPFIGHICPEAFDGGPIALVKDRDIIEYDVRAGAIDLDVEEEELRRRRKSWSRVEKPASGLLAKYRSLVQGADRGAVMVSRGGNSNE